MIRIAESPNQLGAAQAIRHIRGGELSAAEVVEACLAQIERLNPSIHAWVHVEPELARRHAAEVDRRRGAGEPVGTLMGLPVGVKDIFNTIDMPCQMGSPLWENFTPGNDARTVHYLRMADATIPGKTVTAEFAVHAPGPTMNPHRRDYAPGTSSSGSAAAVAAYMVPVALGTQTAGSIIRPASYCGVYGFKPSFGLVPRTGMLKTTDSLDTVGVFAREPEDLHLLFEIIRVHGQDFPLSHRALSDPARQQRGDRPWRVGLVRGPKWEHSEPYARQALERFADTLSAHPEVELTDAVLPEGIADAHRVHATIYDRALAYYFKEEFKQHTLVSRIMYEIIERGNSISPDEYRAAMAEQTALARRVDEIFQDRYDVLLDYSTGGEALLGLSSVDRPDHALIWTLCGLPAISAPVFHGPSGLPFGAQLVGRRYNDYLLLAFVRWLREQGLAPDRTNPQPDLSAWTLQEATAG